MNEYERFTTPRKINEISLISCDADPLSEKDVSIVERAVGSLPPDYRQFLMTSNGGRVSGDVRFPLPRGEFIDVFKFTVVEPEFPPEVMAAGIRRGQRRMIEIAQSNVSRYLMSLSTGAVYFVDSSRRKIAETFTEFVDSLIVLARGASPTIEEMDHSVENFSRYGDHCFDVAKPFFDGLSKDELNECWPKGDEYGRQPIYYAANWSQELTSKYLIDRGVDIHDAVTKCTSCYRITQMMIEAGATERELSKLLLNAAIGIAATSVPEEHYRIMVDLLDRGIQPLFSDADEYAEWSLAVNQIYVRKILSFLLSAIEFPEDIAASIRERVAQRKV